MIYYSDLTEDMDLAIDKDLSRATNIRAVKNALIALITTKKGSRPFMPEFGCSIPDMLFENISPLVESTIETSILTAIKNYEKRVYNSAVKCIAVPDSNELIVQVRFSIITDPNTIHELKLSLKEN